MPPHQSPGLHYPTSPHPTAGRYMNRMSEGANVPTSPHPSAGRSLNRLGERGPSLPALKSFERVPSFSSAPPSPHMPKKHSSERHLGERHFGDKQSGERHSGDHRRASSESERSATEDHFTSFGEPHVFCGSPRTPLASPSHPASLRVFRRLDSNEVRVAQFFAVLFHLGPFSDVLSVLFLGILAKERLVLMPALQFCAFSDCWI